VQAEDNPRRGPVNQQLSDGGQIDMVRSAMVDRRGGAPRVSTREESGRIRLAMGAEPFGSAAELTRP
jgi:hypothetical protein